VNRPLSFCRQKGSICKTIFLLATLAFCGGQSYSQKTSLIQQAIEKAIHERDLEKAISYSDDAISLAKQSGVDSLLVKAFSCKGRVYYKQFKYNEAVQYVEQAIQILRQLDMPKYLVTQLNFLGDVHWYAGRYDQAVELYKEGLTINELIKDEVSRAKSLSNIADYYRQVSNYPVSLEYYFKAIAVSEASGSSEYLGAVYNNMAEVFVQLGDYNRSLDYYFKSLGYVPSEDSLNLAISLSNIGETYLMLDNLELAWEYLNKAIAIYEKNDFKLAHTYCLGVIGKYYMRTGEPEKATKKLLQAVKLAEEIGELRFQAFNYNELGDVSRDQHDFNAAFNFYQKALNLYSGINSPAGETGVTRKIGALKLLVGDYDVAENLLLKSKTASVRLGLKEELKECYLLLAKLMEIKGRLPESLEYYKNYIHLRDSLYSMANIGNAAKAHALFTIEKMEQENELLREKEVLQTKVIAEQRSVTLLVIIVLALSVITIGLIYRSRQINLKARRLLHEKNAEILSQKEKLEEADEMKSKFFANISHELRTPLTLMVGMIDLLRDNKETLKSRSAVENLNIAHRNASQLSKLVDEILDLAKLDSSVLHLNTKPVAMEPFLHRLVYTFDSLAARNEISIQFQYNSHPDLYLTIDEQKIEKVINNLLFNAIKFTPERGAIQVMFNEVNSSYRLTVKDNGIGIPAADVPFVFDRFYQAGNKALRSASGTGIGLSLVKELIELHGGNVTVESVEKLGTSFHINFPTGLKIEPITETGSDATDVMPALLFSEMQMVKYRVLLVEDHTEMQTYVAGLLENTCTIFKASNGAEALDFLVKQPVDLIISDIMMPKLDGYGLLSKLKTNEALRNVPVIMLTARAAEQDKLMALRMGVDDYLVKPFNALELKARVANLLENSKSRKAWKSQLEKDDEPKPLIPETYEAPTLPIDRLRQFVEQRIKDSTLAVGVLADHLAMSERQLYRYLGEVSGFTPANFIKEVRLQHAFQLLQQGKVSKVAELAVRVGFDNPAYFSKVFFQRFGKRPAEMLG
jgi:signal transduction histidine kinase/DNA-binding response OmpR family regulator